MIEEVDVGKFCPLLFVSFSNLIKKFVLCLIHLWHKSLRVFSFPLLCIYMNTTNSCLMRSHKNKTFITWVTSKAFRFICKITRYVISSWWYFHITICLFQWNMKRIRYCNSLKINFDKYSWLSLTCYLCNKTIVFVISVDSVLQYHLLTIFNFLD